MAYLPKSSPAGTACKSLNVSKMSHSTVGMRSVPRRAGYSAKQVVRCHGASPKAEVTSDSKSELLRVSQSEAAQQGLGEFKKVSMVSLGCAKNTVDGA